jgi:hypothetical protein
VKHVVMFSGGVGSWATAKRVAERHGTDDLILLFADTLVEDADVYSFLAASAANVGGELVIVRDGRTPFEVFRDRRWLGNSRLAHCSEVLKQKPCRAWIEANCDSAGTVLYVGIDWSEEHRMPAILKGWAPYRVEFPMAEAPYLDKPAMLAWLRAEGIQPPRSYREGFPHANCLRQGCVKGGKGYWAQVLALRPESYAYAEAEEQRTREHLGREDVTILTETVDGEDRGISLREFRERVEAGHQPDLFDIGGCGCFTEAA